MSTGITHSTNTTAGNDQIQPLKPHQEWDAGEGCLVGRDPRRMTVTALNGLGHHKRPLLKVIRENCLACASNSPAEVRRCGMVACPFWPYRMGGNPFVTRELTPEQRESAAARLRARGQNTDASRKIPYSTGEKIG
jgi:hypothetical protein